MKRDNPFLDTLRWVLFGAVVELLLYLGHLIFLHQYTPIISADATGRF